MGLPARRVDHTTHRENPMTGPYNNPSIGDATRCPNCGSTEAECRDKPHHYHVCNDCGYRSDNPETPVSALDGPGRPHGWHPA